MKSVLISIHPEFCEKILSGQKTLEIRKTKPKLETPFKVYIYCTKTGKKFVKTLDLLDFNDEIIDTLPVCGNGKIIGEFICDKITRFCVPYPAYQNELDVNILNTACVTYYMLHRYAWHDDLYGWNISNLKIYDIPRELRGKAPQSWRYVEEGETT